MAKAEDDEIVLQEVIIDRSEVRKPSVQRSDSLQIPTFSDIPKPKEPVFSRLRGLSPKIAPKFPREKLKSMFRKRKLSSAFPFYKLKGVRFTKDTKEDVALINQSLLDVSSHDAVDVEITLSTPELTEIEKETGVHPYYYTQQTITSAKQLVTGKAVTMRQPSITRSESEENKFKGHRMGKYLAQSNSLPNISHPDEYSQYVHDPIIESSLKKLSETMKNKKNDEKMKKSKMKRKSPPPTQVQQIDDSSKEIETTPSADTDSRRSTLPEITVTRYEPRGSEHLDLARPSISEQSSDHDSDSKHKGSQEKRDSIPQKRKPQSKILQQNIGGAPPPKITVETDPKPHSTSKISKESPPKQIKIVAAEKKDDRKRTPIRRKSPPPKRPEKLSFTKHTPTKQIAGIALKSDKDPSSPTSESDPSTPVSFIPSAITVGRIPPVLQPVKSAARESSISPKRSPTTEVPTPNIHYPVARADTTITISDSKEDLRQIITEQSSPPEPPQRHIPRSGGRGKK